LSGWWLSLPSEKYESRLGLLFPIYGKIKHVPNHQPVVVCPSIFPTGCPIAFQIYINAVLQGMNIIDPSKTHHS